MTESKTSGWLALDEAHTRFGFNVEDLILLEPGSTKKESGKLLVSETSVAVALSEHIRADLKGHVFDTGDKITVAPGSQNVESIDLKAVKYLDYDAILLCVAPAYTKRGAMLGLHYVGPNSWKLGPLVTGACAFKPVVAHMLLYELGRSFMITLQGCKKTTELTATEQKLTSLQPTKAALKLNKRMCHTCLKVVRTKLQVCAGCRVVRYCSDACRIKGWERHQKTCKIGESVVVGTTAEPREEVD